MPVGNERSHVLEGLTVLGGLAADVGKSDGLPGIFAPSLALHGQHNFLTATAQRAHAVRLYTDRPYTVRNICFIVGTVDNANDAVEVGVFDATGTTKLATSGSVTNGALQSNAVAVVPLTAPLLLAASTVYYPFIYFPGASFGITPTILCDNIGDFNACNWFGTTQPTMIGGFWNAGATSPTSIPATTTSSQQPLLLLRES